MFVSPDEWPDFSKIESATGTRNALFCAAFPDYDRTRLRVSPYAFLIDSTTRRNHTSLQV
jgi:hypothetical protein